MTVLYPWALLGLLLLPLLFIWGRRSLASATPRRKRLSLCMRCLLFVLLVVALSDPRMLRESMERHVVWLVDGSRSVGDAAINKAGELANEAGAKGSQSWVAFGGNAFVGESMEALGKLGMDAVEDRATNIAEALRTAQALFPAGKTRTIVLVSDGVQTEADAAGEIDALRGGDVRVFSVEASPAEKPEVLVRSVAAPRQVRAGEPFRIEAEIDSRLETEAEVIVFRNGVRIAARREKLKAGGNHFEFTQALKGEERLAEFSVEVRAAEDTIVDNNRSSALVESEGISKVLLLADKPDQSRYLAWALKQEGIVLDARPAAGAPTSLADLQNYDLVIMDNIPATDFEPEQMKLLASYVRDFGGGLLMTGGDQAFGLGGYYRTPVEDLLPVFCDFEKDQETPSLGIVFVIDRSGSMSGEKIEMAKDAAKAALELLSPRDYAGAVAFDDEAFWVADMQSAADKSGIATKISGIQEGGGTNIAPGIELAYRALAASPAKLRHAIVLTDGYSSPGPFYELATQMASERITVSTVGVGDADVELLKQIATWGGGRFYFTDDARNIPQIFTKETMTASKSALQESPFIPILVRPVDFLSGIHFKSAPFLLGYVITRPKPTAEVWLVSEKGDPLLATWRFGLGKAGAWTSDARNRWAVEWLRWEGFGKFWAQLVRGLSRSDSVRRMPVTLDREGDEFVLKADAVDASGRLLAGVEAEARLSLPDGNSRTVKWSETAPGHFEARMPADHEGPVHVQVVFSKNGEMIERQNLAAAAGYPEEFKPRPPDRDLLRKIAVETGGTLDPEAEAIWKDDRFAIEEKAMWPWLVTAALLLFVIDVALKRIPSKADSGREAVRT